MARALGATLGQGWLFGRAEAELREIIARAVLREGRPRAGDLMRGIWSGAAMDGFSVERDRTPVEPACFE